MSLIDEHDGWRDEADDRKELQMGDKGSLFDHLCYLQSMWSNALWMLSRRNATTTAEKNAIRDLQGAVKLVEKQMEVIAGYGLKKWDLGREIDAIPKADQITGGRGTGAKKIRGFFS